MVVGSDSVDDIISSTLDLEGRLLKLVWKARHAPPGSTPALHKSASRTSMFGNASRMSFNATRKNIGTDIELTEKASGSIVGDMEARSVKEQELESGVYTPTPRPTRIFASIYIGIAVALSTCTWLPLSSPLSIADLA
jgi:hypothetical protein